MATSAIHSPLQICSLESRPNRIDLWPGKLTVDGPSSNRRTKTTMEEAILREAARRFPTFEHEWNNPRRDVASADSDVRHASLPQSSIPERANDALERYLLYETILHVYSAVTSGRGYSAATAQLQSLTLSRCAKRKVYETVFETVHYEPVIEEILNESGFYSRNFELHGQDSLVLLMTYDFQKERFCLRPPRDGRDKIPEAVLRVADALWRHKVKLGATLARMRVKENALTLMQLVPMESRRKLDRAANQLFYTRVNMLAGSNAQDEVISKLCADGYVLVSNMEQLHSCQSQKAVLHLRKDLLVFSPNCRKVLCDHKLVRENYLVLQDVASYSLVERLRPLILENQGDIIVTNCGAGTEALHIASVLGDRGSVLTFGALPAQMQEINDRISQELRLTNIQFIPEPFTGVASQCKSLAKVFLVVCLPPSSLSAVTHPVDFLLQEGDHYLPLLLSRPNRRAVHLGTLAMEQLGHLSHALTFHQAKHIVYSTKSVHEVENGSVVQCALERHKTAVENKECKREFDLQLTLDAQEEKDVMDYYTTVFCRKPEPEGPSPKDVIAQAAARGILDLGCGESIAAQKQIKKKKKARRIFSQHEGIPMTIAAQKKIKKKVVHTQDSKRRFR